MKQRITSVDRNSPAAKAGIGEGCTLNSIDGIEVSDVIDYEHLTVKEKLEIGIGMPDGKTKLITVKKELYEPLGLNFESSLMSPVRQCANHCIFCFIDQMPHGNRKTLYFKDDDWRLSLIMGNYVTLTNVSEKEFERIIERRISPLYISVHATDGEIRKSMMRSKNAENILERLTRLHAEGLSFHCQVLRKTLDDLYALRPECASVAVVPVGLTCHREGLTKITPMTKAKAEEAISLIERFRASHGIKGFVYASDEMYLEAEMELPSYEACGDFEQIENGVGLYRKFEHDFLEALSELPKQGEMIELDSVSGVSIQPLMQKLFDKLLPYNVRIKTHPVFNDFFGRSITVSGLVTARDILSQYGGKLTGRALLLPHTMLREHDTVFLDGMRMEELEEKLNLPVRSMAADDGYDFINDLSELLEELK